jgi:hypothetical protein
MTYPDHRKSVATEVRERSVLADNGRKTNLYY